MLDQKLVFEALAQHSVSFFTGVPDSYLNGFCNYALANMPERNIIAANEGNAIGALLIAKKSLQIKGSLSKINAYYNYDESELKEIQKKIVIFLNKIVYSEKNCLILDKFEKNKYLSVSYIFKCDDKYKMCNNICYKKG